MKDISKNDTECLPSTPQLIKATLLAFAVAMLLLVTAVLPAEYGIDPTGIGSKIGLTMLNSANASQTDDNKKALTSSIETRALTPVWKGNTTYRTDTMELVLQPRQGAEIKALMKAGENFVFNWKVDGGSVSFDMHGERPKANGEFTSYWQGQAQASASGSFDAPFEGTHGWYWQNDGTSPVTIHLTTSGFYTGLYMP